VPGGVSSIGAAGTVYDVSYMQIFQADALRGYGGTSDPRDGRRLLARPMHQPEVSQAEGAPPGAVELGADGSMAALVPARRALTWQLTDDDGTGIVRERNWLSFQAGEIRVCTSCHGINTVSQTGAPAPTNAPQALHALLQDWKAGAPPAPTPSPSPTPGPTPVAGDQCDGPLADKARMRVKPAKGLLLIDGKAVIPKPWAALAPNLHGVRVVVSGVLDVAIPGGAGWAVNAAGTRWIYRDPTGAHGGVRRIDVADRSQMLDGKILFNVRFESPPVLPDLGAHDLSIGFGTPGECVITHFAAPPATSPSCTAADQNVICR
jgi:hypothetical protein